MPKYTIEQMQIKMYNDIFTDYSYENLVEVYHNLCGKYFNENCNKKFKQLVINIFYTLSIYIRPLSKKQLNIIDNFNSNNKSTTDSIILPIQEYQIESIKDFAILMQDNPFGPFFAKNLSYLLYAFLD